MWGLLVLVAALAAQGAQYGDYGAVKMPAYGEYDARDAPLDAPLDVPPTAPDYNDDGNRKVTQKPKDYGISWKKPSRNQYKRNRNEDDYSEVHGRHTRDEDDLKYRDNVGRQVAGEKAREQRSRGKHKRDQHDDDTEFTMEKYIQGLNENKFEADSVRKRVDRIIRRKPRDRDIVKKDPSFNEDVFEEIRPKGRTRVPSPLKDVEGPIHFPSDNEEYVPRVAGGRDSDAMPLEEMRHATEEERAPRLRPAQRARLDAGGADLDSDYYDVKRLQSVRNKLTGYRRNEASEEDGSSELERLRQSLNRRVMDDQEENHRPRPTVSLTTVRARTRATVSTTASTTAATTVTVLTTVTESTLTPAKPSEASGDVDLAKKSMESIMKKASMKERHKSGPATTKPPVLLQVTDKMPTVVLVEASTSADPWLRARDVFEDSPENLARVRQLMRSKFLANAKDIRDLAEDWDQLICDYVDMSALSNPAARTPAPSAALLLVLLLFPRFWFTNVM